jgi:chemotaxis signal transduction protein
MSSQDRVFAAIDLAYFLGLSTRVWHAREYSVIVISTSPANSHPTKPSEHSDGFTYLGLCIREILGNASFRSEDIRSPKGEFPDPIAHFLSGWIDRNSERVHVLDVRALIQD